MERKEIAAFLIDAPSETFIKFVDLGPDGVVVIAGDGKKYRLSVEQLERGALAASMTQTLEQAGAVNAPLEPVKASKIPKGAGSAKRPPAKVTTKKPAASTPKKAGPKKQ
jgi:hypothetical protein